MSFPDFFARFFSLILCKINKFIPYIDKPPIPFSKTLFLKGITRIKINNRK